MPMPRFTIIQLFLAATLIALLLGLFTAADRLGPQNQIRQLCLAPGGHLIAARYQSGLVRVWRLGGNSSRFMAEAFGVPRRRPSNNDWFMECCYFADDYRLIKIETREPIGRVDVHQLDLQTGRTAEILKLPTTFAQEWNTALRGDRLYVGNWGQGEVFCCDIRERKIDKRLVIAPTSIDCIRVSADGRTMAASDGSETVHVVDLESGHVRRTITLTVASIAFYEMALSGDGSTLITPSRPLITPQEARQQIAFWDTHTGEGERLPLTLGTWRTGMTLSRDGKRLAVWDPYDAVEIYDTSSRHLLRRLDHQRLVGPWGERADYFELSSDGALLATSGGNHVMIWEVATGNMLHAYGGGESRAIPIAIFTAGFALWAAAWGLVRKRARGPATGFRIATPAWSNARYIAVGLICLAVAAIFVYELTLNELVDWRDVRVSLFSLPADQLASLITLPILVAVLLRQLARSWSTGNSAALTSYSVTTPDQPSSPPFLLRFCWILMVVGGLFAIVVPIAFLFLNREYMLWTAYYSLFAGVLAISRGAARDTQRLGRTAAIQAINIIALDVLNLVLAGCEWFVLRRASFKQYLTRANISA